MKIRGGTDNPIVSKGIVLHFDAKNPNSYSGSGTTVYDISPIGNHGTLTNASIGTTTANEFTFTDTGEYISFPNPFPQYDNDKQQWTVQAWIKYTGQNTTKQLLTFWNLGLYVEYSTTDKPLNYVNQSTNDHYAYGQVGDFQSGTWTLSTWIYDRVNYATPYVAVKQNLDARSEDTNGDATDNADGIDATIRLGEFPGELGNLIIYNRELTDTEIEQNFHAQSGSYGL